jgi:hypothetical protein
LKHAGGNKMANIEASPGPGIKLKTNSIHVHTFLAKFWDWMHDNWKYASHMDGCCSSEFSDRFKEYVNKFIESLERNENGMDQR